MAKLTFFNRSLDKWSYKTKMVDKYRIPEDKFVNEHVLVQLKDLVNIEILLSVAQK